MDIQDKIKELKDLQLMHEAALNYDAVPDAKEASSLIEDYSGFEDIKEHSLEKLLKHWEGHSCSDIEAIIMMKIKEL